MKTLLLALFIGVAYAAPSFEFPYEIPTSDELKKVIQDFDQLSPRQQITTINEFSDVCLTEIREIMLNFGYDPLKLPDVHQNFSFKPIIITYHGELDLTGGWLQDASTLYRGGDVKITYNDRKMVVNIPLNFQDFMMNYDYSAKFMGIGPDGYVDAKVTNIEVFTSLEINFDTLRVALLDFKVVKTGKIDIHFDGNGIVDWFVNMLADLFTSIFKWLINWIAEIIIRDNLQKIVDFVNSLLEQIH